MKQYEAGKKLKTLKIILYSLGVFFLALSIVSGYYRYEYSLELEVASNSYITLTNEYAVAVKNLELSFIQEAINTFLFLAVLFSMLGLIIIAVAYRYKGNQNNKQTKIQS